MLPFLLFHMSVTDSTVNCYDSKHDKIIVYHNTACFLCRADSAQRRYAVFLEYLFTTSFVVYIFCLHWEYFLFP